jgi:hypothetical protein
VMQHKRSQIRTANDARYCGGGYSALPLAVAFLQSSQGYPLQDESCVEVERSYQPSGNWRFTRCDRGANSFAASIQSQPRFYGKALPRLLPSLILFRADLIDISGTQSIISQKAKECGL